MRIKPMEKPKLILGGVVVVFFIVVGVANAGNNPDPATDTTFSSVPVTVPTTVGPTCDSNAYEGPDGLCTSDALPSTTDATAPVDTQPVDTNTVDVPPPADDNTGGGTSGGGGFHPHVHVCVGHIVRVCS